MNAETGAQSAAAQPQDAAPQVQTFALRKPGSPPVYYTPSGGWHSEGSEAKKFASTGEALQVANQLRGIFGTEVVFSPAAPST